MTYEWEGEVEVTYDSLQLFDLEVTLLYHLSIGGHFLWMSDVVGEVMLL